MNPTEAELQDMINQFEADGKEDGDITELAEAELQDMINKFDTRRKDDEDAAQPEAELQDDQQIRAPPEGGNSTPSSMPELIEASSEED